MKKLLSILCSAITATLLFGGCGEGEYDPSSTSSAPGQKQGKIIEIKEARKETLDNNASTNSETEAPDDIDKNASWSEALVGETLPAEQPTPSEDNATAESAPASNLPPLPSNSPYKEVAFRAISSFPYEVEWETDGKEPDPTAFIRRVPPEVRKMSGGKVAVEGFMIPTMVNEENKVTEFLLLPDQMSCCYGKTPPANGWVVVTSEGTDIVMDQIIRVTGSMVVEERWDEEFFVGLYHMSCDKVTGPAL